MSVAQPIPKPASIGPYDSLRDYVDLLERHNHVMHIDEIDQDRYEGTALAYRLIDEYGFLNSPALRMERIRINGEWLDGPVFGNIFGPPQIEAAMFGVDTSKLSQKQAREQGVRAAMDKLDDAGEWERVAPNVVASDQAPVKEIVLTGDEINLLQYPWFRNNPADAGQFCNMGGVVIQDSEFGKGAAVYRCQIKGEKKIAVGPNPGQDGDRLLRAMQSRGDKIAQVAIAVGADPLCFATFVSKMGKPGEDEFEIAGGLRGKPVDLVKCETSELLVPAHAEMIIEGEVPLDDLEREGPYAEMFGFIGKAYEKRWYMNVKAITHRPKPWFVNSFTAVTVDGPQLAWAAEDRYKYSKLIPNLVDISLASNRIGVIILSIDKQMAGQGLLAGMNIAANHVVAKVTIVVDKDVDVCNVEEVIRCFGSRWQPRTATNIVNQGTNPAAWMDPSAPVPGVSSQIIIDATRQFPGEGGPQKGEPISRVILEEQCGDALELVNRNWEKYHAGWKR